MYQGVKAGKPGWSSKARRFLAWASLGAWAGLAGFGCSSTPLSSNDKVGDPLLGPAPPNATAPAPGHAGLPPIPLTDGLTTNAALASQSPPPQSLAIGASGDGWARKVDGAATVSGSLKAPAQPVSQPKVLEVPKDTGFTSAPVAPVQPTGSWASTGTTAAIAPAPGATAPVTGVPGTGAHVTALPVTPLLGPDTPPAGVPSPEQLKQLLDSRGVIGQKQYPDPAGIRLECLAPVPGNATSNMVYTTVAADYPTAVQAIVHEIDAGHTK